MLRGNKARKLEESSCSDNVKYYIFYQPSCCKFVAASDSLQRSVDSLQSEHVPVSLIRLEMLEIIFYSWIEAASCFGLGPSLFTAVVKQHTGMLLGASSFTDRL